MTNMGIWSPILRKLQVAQNLGLWVARMAVYDFLFVIIELFSLTVTVDALQGKTWENSLLSGGRRSVWAKIWGEGVVLQEYYIVSIKLEKFSYLTMQTAAIYVQSFWHNTGVWQTDRQTDGWTDRPTDRQTDAIAKAVIVLAMRALWAP